MPLPIPKFIKTAFAKIGLRNNIPETTNNITGASGYDRGFGEINMLPEGAGGIPIKQLPAWAQTKDGKGVIKGVILAPLVIVVFAVIMFLLPSPARAQFTVPGVTGTWMNDGHVFAGIDYTRKQSPQCQAGGFDDRSTSNMGLRVNVWQSPSERIRLNSKYTHHSCALNPDRNSYDALGVELEWCVWGCYKK